jgi:prepilin-type N-terminal cleavage/methylation domain-containing protein
MMKHKSGFTLIEVMMAVAVVGLVLTALATLEIGLMRGTIKTSLRFDRLWHMVFFLQEARTKTLDKDKDTKVIKVPDMTLNFERTVLPKESALAGFEDLKLERVTARYKKNTGTGQDSVITFKYKPKGEDEAGT